MNAEFIGSYHSLTTPIPGERCGVVRQFPMHLHTRRFKTKDMPTHAALVCSLGARNISNIAYVNPFGVRSESPYSYVDVICRSIEQERIVNHLKAALSLVQSK